MIRRGKGVGTESPIRIHVGDVVHSHHMIARSGLCMRLSALVRVVIMGITFGDDNQGQGAQR